MNVTHRFTFTEDQLRGIRAWESRGGRATRAEVRTWLERAVEVALQDLPAPKRRRKPTPEAVADADVLLDDAVKQSGIPKRILLGKPSRASIEALPDDARCAECRRTKAEHGRMGFACPAPRRGTFVPENSSQ